MGSCPSLLHCTRLLNSLFLLAARLCPSHMLTEAAPCVRIYSFFCRNPFQIGLKKIQKASHPPRGRGSESSILTPFATTWGPYGMTIGESRQNDDSSLVKTGRLINPMLFLCGKSCPWFSGADQNIDQPGTHILGLSGARAKPASVQAKARKEHCSSGMASSRSKASKTLSARCSRQQGHATASPIFAAGICGLELGFLNPGFLERVNEKPLWLFVIHFGSSGSCKVGLLWIMCEFPVYVREPLVMYLGSHTSHTMKDMVRSQICAAITCCDTIEECV